MTEWNYWKDRTYYQQELKERALGKQPEMEAAKHLSKLVSDVYSPGDSIIDAGCGTGHFILSLEKVIPDLKYTGLDITEQHVKDAREVFKNKGHAFFVGDVREMPFSSGQFDIAICSNTIPHIPKAIGAIKELLRITRKIVFIRMLIGNEILISKKALDDTFDDCGEPANFMYVNIYSEQFLRKELFSEVSSFEILDDHFNEANINTHFNKHRSLAGENIASRVVNGIQFKGYLMLPWKILKLEKNE